MKSLRKVILAITITFAVVMAGCASLSELINLVNCKFSMANISDITWAGINLSNINSVSDLSVATLQKATTAIKNKDFAVSANVNVDVQNQTSKVAKIFAFDYEVLMDDNSLVSGKNSSNIYTINSNSTLRVPVPVSVDLVSIYQNGQVGDVINFALNMTKYGNGEESNVKIKLTPYAGIDSKSTKLPTITLNKTFQ